MSQRKARGPPAMPGVGHSQTQAKARLLPGADRKRSRLSRTRQDPWEERSWSNQRWSRATPGPRGTRAGGLALGRSEACPEKEPAWQPLQAACSACLSPTPSSPSWMLVPPATIAHLTLTHGPPARLPTFLLDSGLLKWPMRSRLYAGGLGYSDLDSTTASTPSQRTRDVEVGSQVPGEADALFSAMPLSPALGDK
uniref:Transcription factor 23 n=1 Tax=Macaca fascicularis TaxID=9541 RepID=A0A7N9CRM8_MACFA